MRLGPLYLAWVPNNKWGTNASWRIHHIEGFHRRIDVFEIRDYIVANIGPLLMHFYGGSDLLNVEGCRHREEGERRMREQRENKS